MLGKQIRQSTGQLAITADKDGRHEYCFSNQMSAIADKMVRYVCLTPSCVVILKDLVASTFMESFMSPEMVRSPSPTCFTLPYKMSLDVVAPIEREIRQLAAGLTSVKDEQEYIVVRERTHRNTAESTNARVKYWSVLQAIVLFSVVAWQVYYLKVSSSVSFS